MKLLSCPCCKMVILEEKDIDILNLIIQHNKPITKKEIVEKYYNVDTIKDRKINKKSARRISSLFMIVIRIIDKLIRYNFVEELRSNRGKFYKYKENDIYSKLEIQEY